ncbi:MAG TPA: hypothetical protein VGE02_10195 [Gemmatimonadales bacterium]
MNESQVVCLPEDRFLGYVALYQSRTWGELRQRVPKFAQREVEARFGDPDDVPGDEAMLDLDRIPGVLDGDWPWPAKEMLRWMPDELRGEFGSVTGTTLNGNYLHIEPDQLEVLTAALEARGYTVRRDDEWMNTISGY